MAITFTTDIAPLFAPYQANMMWRFNLADYETVRVNAQLLYDRMRGVNGSMPPAPLDPFNASQIAMFKQWMDEGYQK